MQAMTPEQNEQWKAAIQPLDYLDFHALSPEGLERFKRRTKARKSAPGWAVYTRNHFVSDGWQLAQPWVPEFALHSEAAMFGLRFLYPEFSDRAELYSRLLLDFLHRVMANVPVDLPELQELHKLSGLTDFSKDEWKALELGLRKRRVEFSGSPAKYAYLGVSLACVGAVQNICCSAPEQWWDREVFGLSTKLTFLFDVRKDECLVPADRLAELRRTGPMQPVATAFLAALEAECPPPDWLPTI